MYHHYIDNQYNRPGIPPGAGNHPSDAWLNAQGYYRVAAQQMDETLYYLYTAAPTRTVTGGVISFGGTSSSSPSGVYEAPDCPVTSNTPGRGIAYALKNDSCSVGFNKWATVTVK